YCKRKGIRFWLAYGTLLGAVSHQGFIPWDDDIDVFVPRPDYEKLIESFTDETGNYKLVTCFSNKNYLLPFAKIQNTGTARVLHDGKLDFSQGFGIDMFPVDGMPDDMKKAEPVYRRRNWLFRKVAFRLAEYHRTKKPGFAGAIKRFAGEVGFKTGFTRFLMKKLSRSPFKEDYDETNHVGAFTGVFTRRFAHFDREWMRTEQIPFEDHLMNVPAGRHEILTQLYGDYMTPLPEEARKSTHIEEFVFRKNIPGQELNGQKVTEG
ncbi:MAG: LicD family protein, partial [Clostridia bacterium]|nr:LicD family protein [Clostridia bacterium]